MLSPPSDLTRFDSIGIEMLTKRNNWIDNIGQVLSFSGLLTAFPFYFGQTESESFWPLGMGFGCMVIFPVSFFALITWRNGYDRWLEFWRYYEIKWGISTGGIKWVYIPIALLGFISMFNILNGI